ncbi:MAG: hypothetical protein IKJ87_00345, partial [Ruminococcus sp.]|nr:hypothetical protein [Ruminococcus sp.]
NISGSVNGFVEVGNITCSSVDFTAPSEIKCATGNILMCSGGVYSSDIEISTDTGSISMILPDSKSKDGNINVSTKTGDVKFTGDESYKITEEEKKCKKLEVNSCNIEASVNTGNITIE